MTMRVIECNICGEALSGATDDELFRRVRAHMEVEHPSVAFDEAATREMIANEAYDASDS
jgi:predicted small metal-binding protein